MVERTLTGLGQVTGLNAEEISITPPKVSIFGLQISETMLITWMVMLILIVVAVVIRLVFIPRFKTVPKGLQNILEMFVDFCEKFVDSQLGKRGASFAAYIFTIALVIVSTSMMSFVLINAFGFYYTGFLGRLKWFIKPKAFMLPVNMVTHAVIPVSLSFRLFGNMFAGMVVMDLLYSVMAVGVPAVLSIYFNLFHVGIQTYIFLVLTLSFMEETVMYGAKR